MNQRIKYLSKSFSKHKIDAYLVSNDANVSYLTDSICCESWLLVSLRKAYYITDFRYAYDAKKNIRGITVKQYTKSPFYTLNSALRSLKVKRVGIDSRHISIESFNKLKSVLGPGMQLKCVNALVRNMRELKREDELFKIKQAVALNLKAYKFLRRIIKPSMTEYEVLRRLTSFVLRNHASFSFAPIIASGPNSSFPHARVTCRRIRRDEPLLIDMGIDYKGYKSDLTRIFFLGKISPHVREVYKKVREAQRRAIKKIRPGVTASQVDKEARNYLKKNRLDKFFGHALGHGIGLDVHESPAISSKNHSELKEGMIFTVEPGVYVPGKFGIRIEDMVLVTKDGCTVLSDCQ